MSRTFWLKINFLFFVAIAWYNTVNAETIGGATCVYPGETYQYSIISLNSTRSYTWCVTGGSIVGVSGCKTAVGYSAYIIYVIWNPGSITRVLTLSWSGGSYQLFPNAASTFQGGTITSTTSQTINYNTAPGTITCSAASGGSCGSTTYSYQWQSSPDNVNWTNISGATSQNYAPGALTSTTYFRRVTASSAIYLSANSNVASVFVNPQLLPGTITNPVSAPIDYNTAPGQITGTVASGGGCSGAYNYQWESSTNNVTFAAISGATSQNYTPGALTVTTYFRRKISCGTENQFSNVIAVSVVPQLLGGYISQTSISIAYNTSPGQINCTVASGGNCGSSFTYHWESSPDNITFTPISGATAQNYTPGSLTSTTSYRRVSSCGSQIQYSNVATVFVMQSLAPGTISPLTITVNYNQSPGQLNGTISAGGNCTNYSYQWESSVDNINFTIIGGATSQNYTPAGLTANIFYRRKTICGSENDFTNTIAITVNQPFEPGTLVPFSQIVTSGTSPALLTANPASGGSCGGSYTYQWQQSTNGATFTDISGAIGLTYNPGNLTTTTYYRRRTTCGAGNYAYTNVSTITVGAMNTTAVNFIKVRDITKPGIADATAAAAVTDAYEVKQATQFFDGIGRLLQTVSRRSTPLQKDMILPTAYDDLGREAVNYLPYASTANTGDFRANAITEQFGFNNTAFAAEQYYYAQAQFEPSPLNRVSLATAPGANWTGANRGAATGYFFNTTTDGVRIWNVTIAAAGSLSSYASPGAYTAGQLYKNISSDEHGKQVVEFKDKEGRVILKKVQLTASIDDGTGNNHTGWLCTYYIYDKLGNLRCVVQPRGVELISGAWGLTDGTILAEQCFRYEYDERKRMTIKKVPGAAAVYMVYDAKDRLIMTQDGNLRTPTAKWLVTIYDYLNRPTETGLWTNGTAFTTHLTTVATSSSYPTTSTGHEQLSVIHYDDYANIPGGLTNTFDATWASHFESNYNINPILAQQQVATKQTRGTVTWTQIRVLGTATFMYGLSIYDDRGRPIQVKSTNITGGVDIATTQYNWNGQPIRTVQKQEKAGVPAQTSVAVTKYNYDHMGRVQQADKKVQNTNVNGGSMPGSYTTIAKNEYTELGQLKKKDLGNKPGAATGTPLSKSEYLYNIRGWLLSANKDYMAASTNDDRYFGFELGYDKNASFSTFVSQYNGNIGGMLWKSEGDQTKRKYNFTYDAANRLLKGDFTQYVSGTGTVAIFNTSAGINFSMGGDPATGGMMKYDANGNITEMWQTGLKLNASPVIDKLAYTYTTNTNKLLKVFDNVTPITDNGKLGDFKDGSNGTGNDYAYDVNGNLTADNNKNISSITYNHLNLPSVVTVTGKGTITYTYDATGNKQKKVTAETGATVVHSGTTYTGISITTATTYLGALVFESKTYSNNSTLNTALGYTDRLQFLAHEEGRIRFKLIPGGSAGTLSYDYFLKDHLGNVRMVLTEELKMDKYPVASLEDSKIATEDDYYIIDNTKIELATNVTGLPAYTNDNGIGNNPTDVPFETANSLKLYKLNSSTNKTGLGITLKVMSGDRIDIHGKSYYFQNNTGGSAANSAIPVLEILNGLLGGPSGGMAAGAHGGVTGTQLNGYSGTTGGINTLLSNQTTNNNLAPQVPKAYINYLFFDEQFKCVGSGFSKLGANGAVKNHFSELQNLTAQKNGYVYIYCSNESPVNVFFDNLQVVHTRGPVLEETHYYPFGLTMSGISSKALNNQPENKYKFNDGTELANKEFSDGSGLEWYETTFRSYDPQIGRFHQIDELAETTDNWSPYTFVQNNPILFNDPLGLDTTINGVSLTDSEYRSSVTVTATKPKPVVNIDQVSKPPVVIIVNGKPNVSSSSSNGTGTAAVGAGVVLSNPEAYPVVAAAGALVLTYYLLQAIGHNNNSDGSAPPPGFLVRDNTTYNPPPIFLKAEDKTDHMGKSKGNTPGNNQAQNKQVESLAKKFKLSRDEQQRLHRRISGEGYGYKEIEEIIKTKDY